MPTLASAQAKEWREIRKPPLRAFVPQQPRRIMLANGLGEFPSGGPRAAACPRHGADPRRIARGACRQGRPAGGLRPGLAHRRHEDRTGDQLDDELEARGARVESGAGLDSTSLGWDCLKESFDQVFATWLEPLRSPEFREEKLAIAKNQINTGIARRNDDPSVIASREARKLGYGKESPYARTAEFVTVAAVTGEDLLTWHAATVHPNNMILGVVGDFDSKAIEAKLRKALGSWPRGTAFTKAAAPTYEPGRASTSCRRTTSPRATSACSTQASGETTPTTSRSR